LLRPFSGWLCAAATQQADSTILAEGLLFYLVVGLAVVLIGLAKGGFTGMGAVGMPIAVLVMDPVQAAAMMLPILIAQDVVGVWAFRKDWDAMLVRWMLPGAIAGIIVGWYFSASVDANHVKGMVGAIAIVFGANRLAEGRGYGLSISATLPHWPGLIFGALSGFTSHIGHAGGPPYQMWSLTRGLDRMTYAGTSAILFAIVNLAKVPAYFALGQFTSDNLRLSLLLMPVAITSTFAGVALVRRVSPERFFLIVNWLMILVGAVLVWKAWISW
jgi:uncharacterized protein